MDKPPDIGVSFTHPDISGDISYVVNEYFAQSTSDVKSRRYHRSIENQRLISSQSDADDSSTTCTGSDMSDAELASVQSHTCKAGCIKKLDAKRACGLSRGNTTSKGDRKRHCFSYQFDNKTVCADCFIYINSISSKYLKNLRKHFYNHGVVPRTHGNNRKMPHNALKYEDVKNIVEFLIGYADRYGMPQPYSRGVNDIITPIYLPTQETYVSIHKKYLDVAEEMDFRSEGVTRKHIQKSQTERDYYKQRCKAAEAKHKSGIRGENMKCIHYTFDFAQPILVPGHVRQEGALYYMTPLKVNWFGILNDGKPHMFNYIFTKGDSRGFDNANSHSSSAVVSMIDDFFHIIVMVKRIVLLIVIIWGLIMLGAKRDGMFGIGRQKLRKNDVNTVMQVEDVILILCSTKVYLESGNGWVWRNWKIFLSNYFKPIPNVRKYFHFIFSASDPGYVIVKEPVHSEEKRVCILKNGKSVNRDLPSRVESAGLSATRQWYLYRNIRSFIPPRLQDITAPMPSVPETGVQVEE
ncbi:LOW QUALITY PROTEIN: hypothetical protein KUTeg_010885 [Tegillarca granosa]|uniref:Uncharacterized protein n=1 Tax=Tegillarca granosa TaxID=220873 RepID=A0ABQ9F5K2_TEGGR|nr:LOW QUALITY PROTEIN: hypothetical protein KUTeg_010885 [Tegillarca granosa]